MVIYEKYGVDKTMLMWNWQVHKSTSLFVKAVCLQFREGSRCHNVTDRGYCVVIGKGDRIRLWEDLHYDSVSLEYVFPRIYTLSNNKWGRVKDFRFLVGSKWNWEVQMRRTLFDWELEQWECFNVVLEGITIRKSCFDALGWQLCPNGLFSISLFRRCLEEEDRSEDDSN